MPAAQRWPSSSTSWRYPPAKAPNTGPEPPDAARRPVTAAVRLGAPASSRAARAGTTARTPRSSARAEYTPPSIGSTLRSTIDRPNRSPIRAPIDMSCPACQSRGRCGSSAMRARSSASARWRTASGPPGIPITVGRAIALRVEPLRTLGPRTPGWTSDGVKPSSSTRAATSGRRTRNASAPTSTWCPSSSAVRNVPPRTGDASKRSITASGPSSVRSRYAAVSPEIPPPSTATRVTASAPTPPPGSTRSGRWRAEPRDRG